MKCINVYSITSSHLDNRTKYLHTTLSKLKEIGDKLSLEIKLFAVSNPTSEHIESNISNYNKRVNYAHCDNDPFFNSLITQLNVQQISNIEKQREVLKSIANSVSDFNLVLEDDVVIGKDTEKNIVELFTILKDQEQSWDVLITCLSYSNNDDQLISDDFKSNFKVLMNKSSYFINRSTAKKLHDFFDEFKYTFKNGFSKFIATTETKTHVLNKHTFLEGSKMGLFPSSTNNENYLFQNKEFIQISTLVKNEEITSEMVKEAEKLYENVKHLVSPDITYIMGLMYYKVKNIPMAKQLMTDACYQLKKNKGLITKSSVILNNAINIGQFDQYKLEKYKTYKSKYA